MQIQTQCLEMGLKALTFTPKEVLSSSPRASPRHHNVAFPPNGDYIGTESCMDLLNHDFDHSDKSNRKIGRGIEQIKSKKTKEKREFPPPLSLLARTENLPSHMPWVLKRYYTSDGRLVLKEHKVRHHEYFRAHRANGRLTLQLVPLDDDVLDSLPLIDDQNHKLWSTSHDQVETNEETNDIDQRVDTFRDEDKKIVGDGVLAMEDEKGVVGANGGPNCLNCIRVRSGPSCIFGVPLQPIRTVHG